MKGWMRKGLIACLAVVLALSIGNLLQQSLHRQKTKKSMEIARQQTQSTQPQEQEPATEPSVPQSTASPATEPTLPPQKVWVPAAPEETDPQLQQLAEIDLEALRQTNEDVIGWIRIPDSTVDYPLMQGEDNAYYLERTWDEKESVYGSIFLECQNSSQMTDFNTIIYGHNMRDNTMFGSLNEFTDQAFLESHPYIYIRTDDGVLRYEVYSTYLADVTGLTYVLSFQREDVREAFLELTLENSLIDTGIQPKTTDRFLTLSTCTGMGYAQRRVVHARLAMMEIEETK